MLVDIFSSFDDHNSVFLSLYVVLWGGTLVILAGFNCMYWADFSRWSFIINLPKMVGFSQVVRSFGVKLGGFSAVVVTLFSVLLMFNLSGLIPYIFSSTSHLVLTFSLGLPFWLSLIISGAAHNPVSAAAGLLPGGAPAALNPFLVLVETVSICVRPITLSVRLAANMSAGHIVLGLIGGYLSAGIFFYPKMVVIVLILVQVGYFMFEIGVALIQAYIFSLLVVLYSDDHAE
uniref:ATP synthase subunit a n=1 Tax=Pseudorimula sp. RSIO35641 TaxID=2652779 RepID=A0A5J6VB57_9VEST|nr:ATP synthase F0 subunit 6 [Pseudorimula sp. RSIO35641]